MAKIVRGPRAADHYTIISNAALRDKRLTWKARGLLAYLLSMDTGWETSIRRLATEAPDGKSAVETGLGELEALGYLERRQTRDADDKPGTFSGTEYHVGDESTVTRSSGHGQTEGTVTRSSGDGSTGPGESATKKTSPKKNPTQEDSSSGALRAPTAPPVETSSSSVQSRNANAGAAANELDGDHGDAARAVGSPSSILDTMMLNRDEQARFRTWLIEATGATNPEGLVVSLHGAGRLSERLSQWRTSENTPTAPVAPAAPRAAHLAWCGRCDQDSRTIVFNRDPHTGRELVRRCPDCNINAGQRAPGSGAAQAIAFEAAVAAATEANGRGRAAFEAARAALPQGAPRRTTTIGDVITPATARQRAESEQSA